MHTQTCGTSSCHFIYLLPPLHLVLPPCLLPCSLYLLSDGLSSVRWMCAFPGQMALLLLRVPGSHFNTRPPCLAWRAIAWGEGSTFTACSVCVCVCCEENCMGARTFFFFFCWGADSSRLCAKETDGLFPKESQIFFLKEGLIYINLHD